MGELRKPFEGVLNIVRFNWHFYVMALLFIVAIRLFHNVLPAAAKTAADVAFVLVLISTLVSLLVSWYIYDFSHLYTFSWLVKSHSFDRKIVNIHAGFDETSVLLEKKFSQAKLLVFDFYDPAKHTEVSIRRARKKTPVYQGTQMVTTSLLPLQSNAADKVFAILAAHEIRNEQERILFFQELKRVVTATGQIIIVEHLRDMANFLAFNVGFFHFYSADTWLTTFKKAGLMVTANIKVTPFVMAFILEKDGIKS